MTGCALRSTVCPLEMLAKRSHIWSAALIVFVWVGAPILSLVHVAHESHNYCAEHQRLEEASHGSTVADHVDSESSEIPAFAARNDANHSSPEHEECSFGESFTRDTASSDATEFAFSAAAFAALVADPPKTFAGSSIPLLLTAPKSSPPKLA